MNMKKIIRSIVTVFILVSLVFPPVPSSVKAETYQMISGGESTGTAPNVSFGLDYVTEIGTKGKNFWYTFTTGKADSYYYFVTKNIDVPAHPWSTDAGVQAEICTAYGEVLLANRHTSSTTEKISDIKLEPNTTYYIRLRTESNGEGTGNFMFRVDPQTDPDENEMGEATLVQLNKAYNRTMAGHGDEDWFSFKTGSNSKYIFYGKNIGVDTHTWSSDRYFRLTLVNSVREEIQQLRLSKGKAEGQIVTLEPNTTYYIQAKNYWEETTYQKDNGYTFKIATPLKPSISKITSSKAKTLQFSWKKDSTATGYQIQYATNSKFKLGKQKTVGKKYSYTLTKLGSKKTYYVRVRSYSKLGEKTLFGKWSTVAKVKVK